jgi:hypothetical protein
MKDTLIPELKMRRRAYHYSGSEFLLLDSCSAHFGPELSALLNQSNLHLLYIAPHSSHLLQCLDMSVLGITKRLMTNIHQTENVTIQTSHIIQLMNGSFAAPVLANIIKPFQECGNISLSGRARDWMPVCAWHSQGLQYRRTDGKIFKIHRRETA